MPSRSKSTSDRKSKDSRHSRNRRDARSSENTSPFIEPLYILDPTLHHSNIPLFGHSTIYGPSQSSWNPVLPVEHSKPPISTVYPNINHPAQLSIGPLYLLAECRPTNENSAIFAGVQSNSIHNNKPMHKNEHVSYYFPQQTDTFDVIRRWKSQNSVRNVFIDTPTQYDCEIPALNRMVPRSGYLSSFISNDSSNQSSEKKNGNSKPPKIPRIDPIEDFTIMRVANMQDINQCEGSYDHSSPNACRRPMSPNDLNKGRRVTCNVKKVLCDPQQMNINTEYDKPLNNTLHRYPNKSCGKAESFRDMTTEDSINDLYRKINDIQSSLAGSPVSDLYTTNVEREGRPAAYQETFQQFFYPRQVNCDSDSVSGTNSTARRPDFRTIEDTGCCCSRNTSCCQQCERNDIPNNVSQCPSMHYPLKNAPFQQDADSCTVSYSPINKNTRVVIAEHQCPFHSQVKSDAYSLPEEVTCDRPCNCSENPVPDSCANTAMCVGPNKIIPNGFSGMRLCTPPECSPVIDTHHCATEDNNSTLCSSSGLSSEKLKISKVPAGSQTSNKIVQSCLCSPNPSKPCYCDFKKEFNNIVEKIEDNIVLKLERKRLSINKKVPKPIEDHEATKFGSIVEGKKSATAGSTTVTTRVVEPSDTSASKPAIVDSSDNEMESNDLNRERPSKKVSVQLHPNNLNRERPSSIVEKQLHPNNLNRERPSNIVEKQVHPNNLNRERPSKIDEKQLHSNNLNREQPSKKVEKQLHPILRDSDVNRERPSVRDASVSTNEIRGSLLGNRRKSRVRY